jgi:hypothetical protein
MSREPLNVDRSVQIETNYSKCGITELYRFEVLTEGEEGEEYNILSLDQSLSAFVSSTIGSSLGQWLPLCRLTYSLWSEQLLSAPENAQLIFALEEWQFKGT